MASAGELERQDDLMAAIKVYQDVVQSDPLHAAAYNRLMVIYRKQKKYCDELSVIKQAIHAYEKDLLEDQKAWKKANRKIATISQTLAKSLGLLNEKGKSNYEEPQLTTWKKRAAVASKRLDSQKRKN